MSDEKKVPSLAGCGSPVLGVVDEKYYSDLHV